MNSIIVIDVGTLSLRSSVVGIDGTMRYSSSRACSPLFLEGDAVEQDPLTWRTALFETLAEAGGYARSAECGVLALSQGGCLWESGRILEGLPAGSFFT